jgi:type III secretion protein L
MSRLFSLIYQGEIHPASDKKVIPIEDYATLMKASEILERAREDVATYKKNVEEECKRLKEQSKKEGYEEGLKQLNDRIIGLDQEIKRLRHEMNKLILPLALKAAKKIVARELEIHPETIVDIVKQALMPATQNHRITIWVNKADKEILEAEKPKIKQILEQVEALSIRERDDIAPGGCIIETENGIINAAIENQWRALEAAFERYVKP